MFFNHTPKFGWRNEPVFFYRSSSEADFKTQKQDDGFLILDVVKYFNLYRLKLI